MSDARQAIAAAIEAGAETHAPEALVTAQTRLATAEAQLQAGTYWTARKAALEAKTSAIDALLRSRSIRDSARSGQTAEPQ